MRDPILFSGRMPWSDWVEVWQAHASSESFKRSIRRAIGIAADARQRCGKLYGSISGGKDSVALAGLLAEAGVDVPWCHAHSWLNLPETMPVVDATCDRFNLQLDVVQPKDDEDQTLFARAHGVMNPQVMADLYARFSGGELLRQYMYEQGYDGHYDGRRADENHRTRGVLFASRGPVFQSTIDKKWSASPMAWWSARDAFAFCVTRKLPIHPFYQRCADIGFNVERCRVDWLFGPWLDPPRRDDDTCRAVIWAYPERWMELMRKQPELGQFT